VVAVTGLGALVASSVLGSSSTPTTTTSTTRAPTTTTTAAPPTTTTTDPGTLPQTSVEPQSDDASLASRLGPLFTAIETGSVRAAQSLFFPESAYVSMKTGILPNPETDYQSRLEAFYGLDLAAYHQSVTSQPGEPTFVGAIGDAALATWIPPGACENTIGYWHLPNVRMVYRVGGSTASFAVASLISWRGVWYVVHLGPNPRPQDVGTVALPASGPGVPGPGGGC
jgi:hypothetical protein